MLEDYHYYLDQQDAMLELDLDNLDGNCVVHNDPACPAEEIHCFLKSTAGKQCELKHQVVLEGAEADIGIFSSLRRIVYSVKQFIGFKCITDHPILEVTDSGFSEGGSFVTEQTGTKGSVIKVDKFNVKGTDEELKALKNNQVPAIRKCSLHMLDHTYSTDQAQDSSRYINSLIQILLDKECSNFLHKQAASVISKVLEKTEYVERVDVLKEYYVSILAAKDRVFVSDGIKRLCEKVEEILVNSYFNHYLSEGAVTSGGFELDGIIISLLEQKFEASRGNNSSYLKLVKLYNSLYTSGKEGSEVVLSDQILFSIRSNLPHYVEMSLSFDSDDDNDLIVRNSYELLINSLGKSWCWEDKDIISLVDLLWSLHSGSRTNLASDAVCAMELLLKRVSDDIVAKVSDNQLRQQAVVRIYGKIVDYVASSEYGADGEIETQVNGYMIGAVQVFAKGRSCEEFRDLVYKLLGDDIELVRDVRARELLAYVISGGSDDEVSSGSERVFLQKAEERDGQLGNKVASAVTSGKGKNIEEVLADIFNLGREDPYYDKGLVNLLRERYNHILECYERASRIISGSKPICAWEESDIVAFASYFGSDYLNMHPNEEDYKDELIAIIKRANILSTGNDPRHTQILSLLLFLEDPKRGTLLQISTGEGKSTITTLLAVYKGIQGHSVDVMTSSPLLAKRDAEDSVKVKLYNMFRLTVAHNVREGRTAGGKKICYEADIVYGNVSSYQHDLLSDEMKGHGTKGSRELDIAIIDEVDSMLIDESAKIAMISSPLPGSNFLQAIYASIWVKLKAIDHQLVKQGDKYVLVEGKYQLSAGGDIILDDVTKGQIYGIDNVYQTRYQYLLDYVKEHLLVSEPLMIPSHLREYADYQADSWVKSALRAKSMSLNKDYVVNQNESGRSIVAIVDSSNTGNISNKCQWQNGLHQFLQLKHGLALTTETLVTSYISNLGYFKRYGSKVYGMSGTLGSACEQDLLISTYDVSMYSVPRFKIRDCPEIDSKMTYSHEEQIAEVTASLGDKINVGRSALVICKTIADARELYEHLIRSHITNKIKLYSRSDTAEKDAINGVLQSGSIIVATNIAGRGADIETSEELEGEGGLHVVVTYLPGNLRVEEQGFGRTARCGNKGSVQLIVEVKEAIGRDYAKIADSMDISWLKELRDKRERERLVTTKYIDVELLSLKDELVVQFYKFSNQLKSKEDNRHKLGQVEEDFGFLVKKLNYELAKSKPRLEKLEIEDPEELRAEQIRLAEAYKKEAKTGVWTKFNKFKAKIMQEYGCGYVMMKNPSYLVREAIMKMGHDNWGAISLLDLAINLDSDYDWSAYYNKALVYINEKANESIKKRRAKTDHLQEVCSGLAHVRESIAEKLIPYTESVEVLSTTPGESELFKQVQSKIKLLKLYIKNIGKTIETISSCDGKHYVKVSGVKILRDCISSEECGDAEVAELGTMGMVQLFDVELAKPPVDVFTSMTVGLVGIAQVVIGGVLAFGGSIFFGVELIMSGISDLITSKGIFGGKEFEWGNYVTEKGIRVAVSLITLGIENVGSSLGLELLKSTSEGLTGIEALKEVGKQVATSTVVNTGFAFMAQGMAETIEDEFHNKLVSSIDRRVEGIFKNPVLQQNIRLLFALDKMREWHQNEDEIKQLVNKALRERSSEIQTILTSVLTRVASSVSATGAAGVAVKAVSYGSSVVSVAHEISKLEEVTDRICDRIGEKIEELASKQQDIGSILVKYGAPKIDQEQAEQVGKFLEQQGIVVDGVLQQDKVGVIVTTTGKTSKEFKFKEYALYQLKFPEGLKEVSSVTKQCLLKYGKCLAKEEEKPKHIEGLKGSIKSSIGENISTRLKQKVIGPTLGIAATELKKQAVEFVGKLYDKVMTPSTMSSEEALASGKRVYRRGETEEQTRAKLALEQERVKEAVAGTYDQDHQEIQAVGVAAGGSEEYDAIIEKRQEEEAEYYTELRAKQESSPKQDNMNDELTNILIVLKANELGYSLNDLLSDEQKYEITKETLNVDLAFQALNLYPDLSSSYNRQQSELLNVREGAINGALGQATSTYPTLQELLGINLANSSIEAAGGANVRVMKPIWDCGQSSSTSHYGGSLSSKYSPYLSSIPETRPNPTTVPAVSMGASDLAVRDELMLHEVQQHGPSMATYLYREEEHAQISKAREKFVQDYIFNADAKPDFEVKNFGDIGESLYKDFVIGKHMGNVPLGVLSAGGELLEKGLQHVYSYLHKVPAAKAGVDVVGVITGAATGVVKDTVATGASIVLSSEQTGAIKEIWEDLPHGAKLVGEMATDVGILSGAVKALNKVGALSKVAPGLVIEGEAVNVANKLKDVPLKSSGPTFQITEQATTAVPALIAEADSSAIAADLSKKLPMKLEDPVIVKVAKPAPPAVAAKPKKPVMTAKTEMVNGVNNSDPGSVSSLRSMFEQQGTSTIVKPKQLPGISLSVANKGDTITAKLEMVKGANSFSEEVTIVTQPGTTPKIAELSANSVIVDPIKPTVPAKSAPPPVAAKPVKRLLEPVDTSNPGSVTTLKKALEEQNAKLVVKDKPVEITKPLDSTEIQTEQIEVRQKPESSTSEYDKKVKWLQDGADEGEIFVKKGTQPRDKELVKQYRREVNDKIETQYGERNPEFAEKAKDRLKNKIDIDHKIDLQLGGRDEWSNLGVLDKGVNRSVGSQLRHQLKNVPEGTKIDKIIKK